MLIHVVTTIALAMEQFSITFIFFLKNIVFKQPSFYKNQATIDIQWFEI